MNPTLETGGPLMKECIRGASDVTKPLIIPLKASYRKKEYRETYGESERETFVISYPEISAQSQ